MATKAVFFDLGGTLLVVRRDRVFQTVLSECGHDASLEAIHRTYMSLEPWWLSTFASAAMSAEETTEAYRRLDARVFDSLFPASGGEEAARVSALVRKRWPELEDEIPLQLYPDVEPTLGTLSRRGYFLGLISNAPADTGRTVDALGLRRYMKSIVISGAVGYSKPRPEIFNIALRDAGVGPSEAAHVGDIYEADVVGARNAGMNGILIDRSGSGEHHDCPSVGNLTDVEKFL